MSLPEETSLPETTVDQLLAEIRRFCASVVRSAIEGAAAKRPERTITTEQLTQLSRQAKELGLLPTGEDGSGAALWETMEGASGIALSVAALRAVARENAGVAFHFHQQSLGEFVARALGLESTETTPVGTTIVALQGRYGLSAASLARLLKNRQLNEQDRKQLAEHFLLVETNVDTNIADSESVLQFLFQAAGDWQRLIVPCFDAASSSGDADALQWAVFNRSDLQVEELPHSHGLNETNAWRLLSCDTSPLPVVDIEAATATRIYREAMQLGALALVAIGLGALEQAYDKATEYAAIRVQGGKAIDQHAAVQQMLARGSSTIRSVELLLEAAARRPLDSGGLSAVLSMRAQAHNLLCDAANDMLQVFGGLGYVRETGLEKIVRDNNHLRQLLGTPAELLLFLAEWERDR